MFQINFLFRTKLGIQNTIQSQKYLIQTASPRKNVENVTKPFTYRKTF